MILKYVVSLFIFITTVSCQIAGKLSKYNRHVGDIEFDKKKDDIHFKICDPDTTCQYYNDSKGFEYEGEKISIEKQLKESKIKGNKDTNGYITVRFLVNCEGKSRLFRVQQKNPEYDEKELDKGLATNLLNFTKSLNGWVIKQMESKKIDYYQYLTYKIENGEIVEVLP
ncbi:hypothetical protein SAMN05421692_3884 [Chryseobacterium indologenes]|uniref:hypothetical protein n=1 Tax=Chryseobacterium indologenes TaxID=253 RepID=UPI0003E07805|nr:hypothetical protein [Chryseobacterium indologenes]GAE66180.1 hypothetical protein CIN01S_14_00550 [Chryseobacterium indologenes NBRC 14944]SFK26110.1 hypothetical protein SAMN05421692_3884 [Chryseobacterium indologenes]SUX51817.1 Uncharacterised protein [Chryseobacterium indologenes]